jgi:Dockerin type I domain
MTAVAFWPSMAIARSIYVGTNIDVVASNPVPVGLALEAFTLTAEGLNGAIPNTFDSTNSGQGGTGITTVGDNLAQVWEFNASPTPTNTLIVPGDIPQQIDTHFLVDSGAIFSAVAPQENRLVANPAENAYAGFGNALWGTFALPSQAAANWDFAYIVVPLNTTVNFDFQLAAPGFPAESINTSWTLSFPPGDVNMDGIVNGQDIALVASNWLQNTRYGDANGDGIVNGQDIALIASNWLSTGGGSASVPEPSGIALATIAALAAAAMWASVRCRRNWRVWPRTSLDLRI